MGKEAKWVVRLDGPERQELETLLATPRIAAERVLRARVLLKADEGVGDRAERNEEPGPLAIHDRGRPHQTPPPLSRHRTGWL